jgi:hypothetical protein
MMMKDSHHRRRNPYYANGKDQLCMSTAAMLSAPEIEDGDCLEMCRSMATCWCW